MFSLRNLVFVLEFCFYMNPLLVRENSNGSNLDPGVSENRTWIQVFLDQVDHILGVRVSSELASNHISSFGFIVVHME